MKINSYNERNYLTEYQSQYNKPNNNTLNISEKKKNNNSKNYFRLQKEIENNQNPYSNSYKKQNIKKNNTTSGNSLNEKIYSNYSKKLGDYYQKNKEDIILYGSKKYDLLTVDNLVDEMKQYRNKVIEKIKQNPNKFKNKNYGLKSQDDILILTPLAEKERSKMGNNEKELFNEAERRGVVMRRIEYANLLDQNDNNINNRNVNAKVFMVMKDAVGKIEKCWLFYKNSKKRRLTNGAKLLENYIKRKILKYFDYLNNEKLKNIYMTPNSSVISFKNDLNFNLKNNNNFIEPLDEVIKIKKPENICFFDKIRIDGNMLQNKKKLYDDLQKKYYKLILDYKIAQEELNKYKKENENLKNEMNMLKAEKDELIKNFDNISDNYNNLLKEFDSLNEKYTNLLNNQTSLINSSLKESKEYKSLLNEFNALKEKYNSIFNEYENMKKKYQELYNNNNNLKNKYQELDNNYINLKNKYQELDNNYINFNNKYQELNNNYNILKNENKELNNTNINLEKENEELNFECLTVYKGFKVNL